MVVPIEARNRMISELNGDEFSGDGSEENPLVSLEEKDNIFALITKVIIYASFFKAVMFFTYEGVIASYNHENREFGVDTDKRHELKTAIGELFHGKDRKPTVVEEKPLLRVIK
ncbi:MAG: hypothetical protein OEX81_03990 [Candidatus Pacebacteria bacterium]|nr:hypothetical protein [Candidatus Paceibacterota bacterium]